MTPHELARALFEHDDYPSPDVAYACRIKAAEIMLLIEKEDAHVASDLAGQHDH